MRGRIGKAKTKRRRRGEGEKGSGEWQGSDTTSCLNQGQKPAFVDVQLGAIARVKSLVLAVRNTAEFPIFRDLEVRNWITAALPVPPLGSKHYIDQSAYFFEMKIEGYQFGVEFDSLRGNPNIVRRDGASAMLQVHRYPGIAVCCYFPYLNQLHHWMFEEGIQVSHVVRKSTATAKSKHQLTGAY